MFYLARDPHKSDTRYAKHDDRCQALLERYTYPKASIAAPPHASRSIRRQNRLHRAVGVLPRLAAIGVGDKLGLRGAVRMFDGMSRRGPRRNGLGWNFPLGNTGR